MKTWAIVLYLCFLLAGNLTYVQPQPISASQAYAEAVPTFESFETEAGGQKVKDPHAAGGGGENGTEPTLDRSAGGAAPAEEDLKALPDEEKYMRALDEVGKIGDAAKGKPLAKGALDKKLKAIKSKYGLGSITMVDPAEESVKVEVKHKAQINSNNLIEIKLVSKAEQDKQFSEAVADLETALKTLGDPETGAITKAQAETAAHEVDLAHEVIDGTQVQADDKEVTIKGDVGEEHRKMLTKPVAKGLGDEAEGAGNEGETVAEELTMPKTIEKSGTVELKQLNGALESEAEAAASGALIFEEPVSSPKEALKELLDEFGKSRLDEARSVLKLPAIHENGLDSFASLHDLGAYVSKETGLSKIFINKSAKGWSLSGQINPTVANLASYAGAPAGLQPLIAEIKAQADAQKPSKEYFISICNKVAAKYGAVVSFNEKWDRTNPKSPFQYTSANFSKGDEVFDTTVILDISRKNICPACDTHPGERKPHNIVSGKIWRDSINAVLDIHAPQISVNMDLKKQILGAGDGTGGIAVTEDKQCANCDELQSHFSLLQRSASGNIDPRFLGLQFQKSSQNQLETFTKDKISKVVGDIVMRLMIDKKVGSPTAAMPGDDLFVLINDDIRILAFESALNQMAWTLSLYISVMLTHPFRSMLTHPSGVWI